MESSTNKKLASKLLSFPGSGNIDNSFVEETFLIENAVLINLTEWFETGPIITLAKLKARKFTIKINHLDNVQVYLGEIKIDESKSDDQVFAATFFPYLIQTEKQLYLLVASDFDLYEHINLEPSAKQTAVESYHEELRQCLGVREGKAYHGTGTEDINPTERERTGIVAVITTHFNQISENGKSYILFSL